MLARKAVTIAPLLSICLAVIMNVTVDDVYGNEETNTTIQYDPERDWNAGATCSGCLIPDSKEAHMGTWHYGALRQYGNPVPIRAKMQFPGTAVYVYCILDLASEATNSMNFTLDDEDIGEFILKPEHKNNFQYNALVFNATNLTGDEIHTLEIETDDLLSDIFLDYIVYTYDDGRPPKPQISPGTIAGAVVGSVLGATLVALFFICWRRRRRRQQEGDDETFIIDEPPIEAGSISPFPPQPKLEEAGQGSSTEPAMSGVPRSPSISSQAPAPTVESQLRAEMEELRREVRELRVAAGERTRVHQMTPPPGYGAQDCNP